MIKPIFVTIMLAVTLPLTACSHQSKEQVSQSPKTRLGDLSNQNKNLIWKCPTVSFERHNPDGTYVSWGICGIEVGNNIVSQNRGAIVPLGKLTLSEDLAPKTFKSYTPGETYTSGPIKFVTYIKPHTSKAIVGYEVSFPDCAADQFTLYIEDKDEDGALESLNYVFETMKFGSYCGL